MKMRALSAFLLVVTSIAAFAERKAPVVEVTGTGRGDIDSHYYVDYTIDGNPCRSSEVGPNMNAAAFRLMSDKDKKKVLDAFGWNYAVRAQQFGAHTQELVDFANEHGRWKELVTRIKDKQFEHNYPGLQDVFTNVSHVAYAIEQPAPRFMPKYWGLAWDRWELYGRLRMLQKTWRWGCAAYEKMRDYDWLRTQLAVKSVAGDLIQLLCDKCLVPNITPTGISGVEGQIVGTVLDYLNTATGAADEIVETAVGKRVTADAAGDLIDRFGRLLDATYGIAKACIDECDRLRDEIDAEYEKICDAEKNAQTADEEANVEANAPLADLTFYDYSYGEVSCGPSHYDQDKLATIREFHEELDALSGEAKEKKLEEYGAWFTEAVEDARSRMSEFLAVNFGSGDVPCVDSLGYVHFLPWEQEGATGDFFTWRGGVVGALVDEYVKRWEEVGLEGMSTSTGTGALGMDAVFFLRLSDPSSWRFGTQPSDLIPIVLDPSKAAEKFDKAKRYRDLLEDFESWRKNFKQRSVELVAQLGSEYNRIEADLELLHVECHKYFVVGHDAEWLMRKAHGLLDCAFNLATAGGWDWRYCGNRIAPDLTNFHVEQCSTHEKLVQGLLDQLRGEIDGINGRYSGAETRYRSAVADFENGWTGLLGMRAKAPSYVKDLNQSQYVPTHRGSLDLLPPADVRMEIYQRFRAPSSGTLQDAIRVRKELNAFCDEYADWCNQIIMAERRLEIYDRQLADCIEHFPEELVGHDSAAYFTQFGGGLTPLDDLRKLYQAAKDRISAARSGARSARNANSLAADYDGGVYNVPYSAPVCEVPEPEELKWDYDWKREMSIARLLQRDFNGETYAQTVFLMARLDMNECYEEYAADTSADGNFARIAQKLVAIGRDPGAYSFAYSIPDYLESESGAALNFYETQVAPLIEEIQAKREQNGAPPLDLDEDPTDPTDSADPSDPTGPTDPSDPTDPADPSDPSDPTDPTDPAAPPSLFSNPASTPFMGDATYMGWQRAADGSIMGLITIKAAKPTKVKEKDGVTTGGDSKLTITYTPLVGKKKTIKLEKDQMPLAGKVVQVNIPDVGMVTFGGDSLGGAGLQAGKDLTKSKDKDEKNAAKDRLEAMDGVWTFALGTDLGYAALSVTVKKGKGKLTGALPDGTKVSISSQGILGERALAIPFVFAKKASFGLVLWVGDGGDSAEISDLTTIALADGRTLAVRPEGPSAAHRLAEGDGHAFDAGSFQQPFAVEGRKWTFAKHVKKPKEGETDPNPYGVKLSFTEKTGVVKGSFTVPATETEKARKYTVNGVVVGDVMYGAAISKGMTPIPVVTGTAAPPEEPSGGDVGSLYCVVDLSGGATAASYPVKYLDAPPSCGFNVDTYKTTKLVLRRIDPGTFTMGSAKAEGNQPHEVTLTKPYYIGVFEITQRQWELVMGSARADFGEADNHAVRPMEMVSYWMIRGSEAGEKWPANNAVDADSFAGRMRARTGIDFDLPTEAQWEYACRAGTATDYNNGTDNRGEKCPNMDKVGRYWSNGGSSFQRARLTTGGTAKVGSYQPNAWGLYDMHGNVDEWCLDWYAESVSGATDPLGPSSGSLRVMRGGCWYIPADRCTSSYHGCCTPAFASGCNGLRLAMPLSN